MATIYVSTAGSNSNSGTTPSSPKGTIVGALAVASAGDTISVASGTYTGNVVTTKGGSASGGYITIRSATKYGAKLVGNGSTTEQSVVELNHPYLRLQDFEITGPGGSGTGARHGVRFAADNLEIIGNHIHTICQWLTEGTSWQGGAGLQVGGTTRANVLIDGNVIHDIGLRSSTQQLVHGMYVDAHMTNSKIQNNLIFECEDFGIHPYPETEASGWQIINNTVVACGRGILQATNGVTRNNIVYNTSGAAYDIRGSGNVGSNNIYGGTGSGITGASFATGPTNPLFVNYNTSATLAGDFSLQSGSPARNAGTATNAPSTDIVGTTRPQGASVDLGCYEMPVATAPPPTGGGGAASTAFPYTGFGDGVGYAAIPTGTTTVTVTSSAALTTALTNAAAGQRIVLGAATYSGSFTLSGKSGTATSGITIEAAAPGTAVFAAGSTITVNNCAYVTIKGLTFPYELTSGGNVIGFRGTSNRCRVTRNTFGPATLSTSTFTTKSTFVYMGDDTEHIRVDHNEIRNKTTPGNAVLGDGNFTTSQVVRHMRWDHNIVRGIKPEVSNEKEPFRLGVSTMSKSMSYSVVERNFFTDCIAEPEIVSVKAGGVRVSGNTVLRCIGGLVYRHGTGGLMADNYIVDRVNTFGTTIGSGGFRFYDANHTIAYNYVDGVRGGNFQGPLLLDTGDAEGTSTDLAAHWRVVNPMVERNVLVGNPEGIRIGDNYDSAPTGATIRDNIVAQSATGVAITQLIAPVSSTLTNNAYYATPASGGMVQGADTIWRKDGYGPRLTYLQQADVGPNGDVADTDGTGTLVAGGTPVDPGTATTAAEKFGWGAPLGLSDEFEYTGAPASTKWSVYDSAGHDGNGLRSPARVTVANGKMVLTGLAGSANTAGLAHKIHQTYGRWEVRCRSFYTSSPTTPGTLDGGYHPVLIVWPTSDIWPGDGEYDFLENGEPGMQAADAFLHYPSLDGANHQVDVANFPVDLREFHNFAFEWSPDGLKGWVDGQPWFTHSGGAASDRKALQAMSEGQLTVQLDAFQATGCLASTMELEWVRVYSLTPSGPVAGPQTITAVGFDDPEAFGVPTITGANPAPPPGSVLTQLGVNTVLGSSTLGYTQAGTTPPAPGVQTVSAAGGIGTAQAFGRPVLTVADGPQTVSPVGIPPTTDFGRPQIGIGPPASPPAPGGVLVPTLFAVAGDGITLTPLPAWESMTLSPVRNSPGSVEITYPAGAPGFSLLHDSVSASPLRALEIRVWLGGNATGAVGGWLVSKVGDDLEPGSPWRFSGHFHEWILSKAIVAPQPISEVNKNGELRFAGATAGLILVTVMDQAQARGALPLVTRDFTTTHDSAGVPWAKAISSLKLAPKTTVAQVADKLVELAMCEYEMTAGRMWRAFNPGGRGTDQTTGPSPLTFAHGVDLSQAARRETMRDAGTAVLVAGSEGFYAFSSSPSAQAQLGWRAEVSADAGQLDSQSAVQAVAASYLEAATAGVAERSAAVEFGPGAPLPLLEYGVGDWAYLTTGAASTGARRERLRIAQVELEFRNGAPAGGKVVLNDLITDKLTALYRRLNAISTGDAVVGTSEATPGGSGEDTIPPAAPTGVTVASDFAYQQPGESETYALVIVGWAPVTTNAYADAATADKVRAAGLIADRMHAGLTIAEDWTWSGAPAVVGIYNHVLLDEAQAAVLDSTADNWMFGVEALAWLDDYAVTHSGGGAVTDDVANYRVQWRYTGSQVVPSRQDPGNVVPGPTPPRDPNAFPEDAAWFEPGESPTTTNRIEFGSVLAGRAIQVRVSAVDRAGNRGPWSSIVGIVTAIDNKPPPVPSKPIATAWFRTMDITWDGKGSSGEDMFAAAPDVAGGGGIEVHVDTGIDFTPDRPIGAGGKVDLSTSRTYKATLYAAGTWNVVDLTIGTTYYARFVAVDKSGNASDPSATSDGVLPERLVNIDIGPDAIGRAQIIDGEIVRAKIADLAVNDAKIESLDVGKIRTGTLTAQVTVSGRIQTPLLNGNQIQIDNAGIRMYRGNTVVGRWEVFDGSILITGQYSSAVTGQRVVINPGGGNPDTIRFYPTFSDVWSSIDSVDFQGGTIAGIRIVGSGTTAVDNRGMLIVRDQYVSMVHGRTDLSYWGSEIWVEQAFTRNRSATVDLIIDDRLTPQLGTRRVSFLHWDTAGVPVQSTHLQYNKGSDGRPWFWGVHQNSGLKFDTNGLAVTTNNSQVFGPISASAFLTASSEQVKDGIREVAMPEGRTSWDLIEGAPAQEFTYRDASRPERPLDPDGNPVMVQVANPDLPIEQVAELPAAHPDKLVLQAAEWDTPDPGRPVHRFPLAEDLAAIDPALVLTGNDGDLRVDLRDTIGVLWDAVDKLIKRTREIEATLPRRISPRPQRGDVTGGIRGRRHPHGDERPHV